MLSLSQRLAQQQKLSPQQIQYQKLLQLNTLALEQRIKNELEINPILDEVLDATYELTQEQVDTEPVNSSDGNSKSNDEKEFEEEKTYDEADEFSVEDYMNQSDLDDESYYNYNGEENENKIELLTPEKTTLTEVLLEQLRMLEIDDDIFRLGDEIIGNLNEDGYLTRDVNEIVNELNMFEGLSIKPEDGEKILKKIQKFDPPGIAARNLQECLLIQLKRLDYDPYYKYLAEQLLINYFDEFTKKRYDAIRHKLNLSDETLKIVMDLITKLNPKPGEGNTDSAEMNQITPDFIIEKEDDNFIITLNDRHMPSVTISQTYLSMLETNKKNKKASKQEKESYKFLREKFESAKWFIACIQQRRETLMKIMRAILEKQFEFFDKGPKLLKPMIYKDIADEIQMDISTISRVVNGKYVQSPMGIHELKYFFSEGLSTDSGEEVSNKHIKERIKEIIDAESKKSPLSDDKIAEMLNEEGIHIARRTVAKYREQLRLPVARLRKEL